MHPWIVGELACGNLKNRNTTLIDLQELPEAAIASQGEVLAFIEKHKLMGQGIGYMDVNLLVSAALDSLELWTNDRRLYRLARTVGVQAKLNRSQQ
jgi:predicted nucleic acid-binding protein